MSANKLNFFGRRIICLALGLVVVAFANGAYSMDTNNTIDDEFLVKSGGEELYIRVRGQNINNPVLLYLHGGPGELTGPLNFQAYAGPELEKRYIIGYLHQRNTCKSPSVPIETLTVEQFIEDVYNVVAFLREKFNKDKIFLLGHSFGGILGYMYLIEYEDHHNIEKFVSAGGAFSADSLEENGYKTAIELAEKTDNQKALDRLNTLGPPPYETFQEGMVWRMLIVGMLNGMKEGITKNFDMSKVMTVTGTEKTDPEWQKKMMTIANAMWNELKTVDIEEDVKKIHIPILMIAGAKDIMVPFTLMEKGYENLGGEKEYFILENSNHMMFIDEPDLFVTKVIEFFQKQKPGDGIIQSIVICEE
jgi:pimeloyl-ACP methyl ester carboxylesterase